MEKPPKNHDLYRHFDADGKLLYVGISFCAVLRLSQHRTNAGWYDDIVSVTIEKFATREEVLEAEKKAIQTENPVHNIKLVPPPEHSRVNKDDHRNLSFREKMIFNMIQHENEWLKRRCLVSKVWYNQKEAAEILNVTFDGVIDLYESGELSGFKWSYDYIIPTGYKKGQQGRKTKYKFSGWQLLEFLEIEHRTAESERNHRLTEKE